MPKKVKEKQEQASKNSDPLPQVWLPDQVSIQRVGLTQFCMSTLSKLYAHIFLFQLDFSGASYDKGPRMPNIDGSRLAEEEADASALMPTEDEEERMARFWAMEEANAPKGWEDDKEIDYEELAEKAAAMGKGQKSASQEPPSEFSR